MSSSPDNEFTLRAHVTSSNGEISCSVEETNRIRAALGLKPLRPKPLPSDTNVLNQPAKSAQPFTSLRERLSKARQRRVRLAATHSITQKTLGDTSSDDDEEDDALLAWVQASRAREKAGQKKQVIKTSGAAAQVTRVTEKSHRSAVAPALPNDDVTENATLVLADAPVVGGGDVLENAAKSDRRKRERSPEIDGANYDGTDAAEFAGDKSDKRGGLSVALGALEVENDYRADLAAEKVFAKRKRERRAFKKRKREIDGGVVVKGRMEELRKKRMEQQDRESSEEDALYESLTRARRVAKRKEEKRSVDVILEAINKANEADGGEEAEDAEKIVYGEMEQFLRRLPSATDARSYSNEEVARGVVATAVGETIDGPDRLHDYDNLNKDSLKQEDEEIDVEQRQGREVTNASEGGGDHTKVQESADYVFDEEERGGQSGVAGVLRRLRATGSLNEKQEQYGRARDRRFNDQDDDLDKSKPEPEIKLRYTDDQGNELTRKEAFRQLCHKFHGNAPGQNKREKRLRKMLGNMKARNMRYDDTPLASAAALKKETRRVGSAHVVLSGPAALQKRN